MPPNGWVISDQFARSQVGAIDCAGNSCSIGEVHTSVHSIDERMLSFTRWHGEVPPEARRVEDFEATIHAAIWIRRNLGLGVASEYVIGFQLGESWWTLFFDRIETLAPRDAEVWRVESYSSGGRTWTDRFYHWPEEDRWQVTSRPSEGTAG